MMSEIFIQIGYFSSIYTRKRKGTVISETQYISVITNTHQTILNYLSVTAASMNNNVTTDSEREIWQTEWTKQTFIGLQGYNTTTSTTAYRLMLTLTAVQYTPRS